MARFWRDSVDSGNPVAIAGVVQGMNARIFWGIENHAFPHKDEHKNGWYLTRYTVSYKDGKPNQVVERKPIAKIEQPSLDHVREIEDAVESKTFVLMPRGWMFDALAEKLK